MTRSLGTDFANSLNAAAFQPFFAVHMAFDGGDLRLWTGFGTISFGGNNYSGGGEMLSISGFDETSEIRATGISVVLSALPATIISSALNENYQGRDITVYFGTLDDTGSINDTPYVIFKGQMDQMSIQQSAETATVVISGESRLIDLEIARTRRYTSEDQKIDYPNDKGLEFIADLQDKTIVWGGK
jgi:hypothetical protein